MPVARAWLLQGFVSGPCRLHFLGFIYATDVESCEPASGTLTFFRVNETGIALPTTTESPSTTLNSSEVEKILNQSANQSANSSL